MNGLIALKKAQSYVDEALQGSGSLVGKNVTITDIEEIEGGNRITFSYTLDDGTPQTSTLDVMNGRDGADGVDGISPTIAVNPDNTNDIYKLDITDTNGTFTTSNLKGEQGLQGVKGDKGDNGDTPYIGENGHWWYGDTDSGVPIPSFLDLLQYVDETYGIQDTPIGHILTHMGNNAPKHYLVCNGGIYNIADYPYLAKHFQNEFGSANCFGGDGETTFAVPDLRGEFLRGSGANSHANNGNGATVGTHQNATQLVNLFLTNSTNTLCLGSKSTPENDYTVYKNSDLTIAGNGQGVTIAKGSTYTANSNVSHIQARPTNTSVLYCIKYEPTYFLHINEK